MVNDSIEDEDSMSFACGGWLYLYMFGVARALQSRNLDKKFRVAGCSAGALTGAGLLLGGNFDDALVYVKDECIPEVYNSFCLCGLFNLRKYISKCIRTYGNLDKWQELKTGQLQVAVTRLPYLIPERVTTFKSENELYESLLASSAVFPLCPLVYRNNCWCIDGGVTDFQPIIDKNTIKVSPFYFADADIKPSRWVPIWWALIPPRSTDTVDWLYRLGYDDACRWIDSHGLVDSKTDSTPTSTTSSMYTTEPPKKPHPYDIPRRISFDRFLGYDLNELMYEYVAYTLDLILVILVVGLLKPTALFLVYLDLFFQLGRSAILFAFDELYSLSPMVALCVALLTPHIYVIMLLVLMLLSYKVVVVGPSESKRVTELYECFICIASLSLLARFVSCTLSQGGELRKHNILNRMSLMYRIVRHSL